MLVFGFAQLAVWPDCLVGLARLCPVVSEWPDRPGPRIKYTENRVWAKICPPEGFMRSKSAQNLMLMPNLLSDYLDYTRNLNILSRFYVVLGVLLERWGFECPLDVPTLDPAGWARPSVSKWPHWLGPPTKYIEHRVLVNPESS